MSSSSRGMGERPAREQLEQRRTALTPRGRCSLLGSSLTALLSMLTLSATELSAAPASPPNAPPEEAPLDPSILDEPLDPSILDEPLDPSILDEPLDPSILDEEGAEEGARGEAGEGSEGGERAPPSAEPLGGEGASLTLRPILISDRPETLTRLGGSAHRVAAEELEEREPDDIHRVLTKVPGVYVRGEDGFGLRPNIGLRGANSDRSAKISLMEDGILIAPAPYSAPAAYYFPLTTRLAGVEVFKGPAAIRYGPNTIGGAVNLVTQPIPGQGWRRSLDLAAGSFGTYKAHLLTGYGAEHFGLLFEAARLQSDGFKELDGGGDTGFAKNELMLKARLNNSFSAQVHHQLRLKLAYADEESNETYLGLTDEDFAATPYRRYAASRLGLMDWTHTQARLGYQLSVGEDFQLRADLYRHDFYRSWRKLNGLDPRALVTLEELLRDPSAPGADRYLAVLRGEAEEGGSLDERILIGDNQRAYLSQGIQLVSDWSQGWGWFSHSLQLGFRFHQDRIDRDHFTQPYELNRAELRARGDNQQITENRGETLAISAHISDELRFGQRLHLSPGVRLENYRARFTDYLTGGETLSRDELLLLPGVGAWAPMGESWGLLAGVHQGFSPLAPGADPTAKPEQSTNYEAGARWSGEALSAELIGFYNQYENLIGVCTQSAGRDVADLDRQFNAGAATIRGLESTLRGRQRWGAQELSVDLSYTLTDARFDRSFSSSFSQWGEVAAEDLLPYVPLHQGSATVGLHRASWGAHLTFTHVGEMRDSAGQGEAPEGERVPAQEILDGGLYYLPFDGARLYLLGDNLLAREYLVSRRPFGARPGKPFQLRVGLKYSF